MSALNQTMRHLPQVHITHLLAFFHTYASVAFSSALPHHLINESSLIAVLTTWFHRLVILPQAASITPSMRLRWLWNTWHTITNYFLNGLVVNLDWSIIITIVQIVRQQQFRRIGGGKRIHVYTVNLFPQIGLFCLFIRFDCKAV